MWLWLWLCVLASRYGTAQFGVSHVGADPGAVEPRGGGGKAGTDASLLCQPLPNVNLVVANLRSGSATPAGELGELRVAGPPHARQLMLPVDASGYICSGDLVQEVPAGRGGGAGSGTLRVVDHIGEILWSPSGEMVRVCVCVWLCVWLCACVWSVRISSWACNTALCVPTQHELLV